MAPSSLFLQAGAIATMAMSASALATTPVAVPVAPVAVEYNYAKTETYSGSTFFDNFNFRTGADPTNGFVKYVDRTTATNSALIRSVGAGSYVGVDFTSPLTATSAGRASVRLESKKTYNGGLFIADFSHIPSNACGTWPSFWTTGLSDWPANGEIDIIEGINRNTNNLASLHTSEDCVLNPAMQGGTLETSHCSNTYTDNDSQWPGQGCGVKNTNSNSYGSGFNANGGGVYAMEWTDEHIKIWNFERSAIPVDILNEKPDTSNWGKPTLSTEASNCNTKKQFKDHSLIISTTFCGEWAGPQYGSAGCPQYAGLNAWDSCKRFVAQNPSAFSQSYWMISSIKVYQREEVAVSSTIDSSTSTSSTFSSSSTSSVISTTSSEISSSSSSSSIASSSSSTSTIESSTSIVETSTDVSSSSVDSITFDSSTSTLESTTESSSTIEDITTSSSSSQAVITPTIPSISLPFANSTMTTMSPDITLTATITETNTHTITSCAATITNCPFGSVVTDIVTRTTTWCPDGTDTAVPSSADELTRTTIAPQPTVGEGETVSTIYTTATQTIVRCPDEVKNCPNKDKTQTVVTETYIIGTTICPIDDYPQPTVTGHFEFSASISESPVDSETVVTRSTVVESQTYVWTETACTEELPIETPVEELPEVSQPVEGLPLETPVEGTPEVSQPVEEFPIETPVEGTPEVSQPVEEFPIETPVEGTPEVSQPVEESPIETPVEGTPEVSQPVEELPIETPVEVIPEVSQPVEEVPQVTAPVEEPATTTPVIEDVVVIVTPMTEEFPAPTINEPEVPAPTIDEPDVSEVPAETPEFEAPVFTGAADKFEAGAIAAVFAVGFAIMWDM